MKSSNRLVVAMLVIAALAAGFWVLLLSPKREEASELGTEVEQLQSSLTLAQSQASEAEVARKAFPEDYRELVVLGKAVPGGEETSSLLVSLNQISGDADAKFDSISLAEEGGESTSTSAPTAPEAGPSAPVTSTTPPTEAAAALAPLGAAVGPAGLSVMPYNLSFRGEFTSIADFIDGIDSLVTTTESKTVVAGRLITIDGFVLTENPGPGFPSLNADFSVTTYLVPPEQGVTAGATETAPPPAAAEATGTPSSFSTNPAQ